MAMRYRATFSCRFPDRIALSRTVFGPDQCGIGATYAPSPAQRFHVPVGGGPHRQLAKFADWATANGFRLGRWWPGSGLGGKCPKLAWVLSDPPARLIVVEHRDRPACFGLEHLHAAPAVLGRRIMVVDDGETADDLVGDMTEVLTSMCARMYGPRGARNRALRAVPAAKQHSAPVAAAG
jgi:putative resolvase